MPELPEVEVTRRSFAHKIAGASVTELVMGKPLRWPLGVEPTSLRGWRVGEVDRRGKYLWLRMSHGDGRQGGLLVHLGMSGSLRFERDLPPAGPHDHMQLSTSQGELRLRDPRRFGAVVWGDSLQAGLVAKLLHGLGREPLDPDLDAAWFAQALKSRSAPIKQVLLAGDIVVGAGNIYCSEALFRARIHPRTPACEIGAQRAHRLLSAVQSVLRQALDAGGSSLRDFMDATGSTGHFQTQTQVYGREGLPCVVCAAPVRRFEQAQRSTYYCPRCQRR